MKNRWDVLNYIKQSELFGDDYLPSDNDLRIIGDSYGFAKYQAIEAANNLWEEIITELRIKDVLRLMNKFLK